MPSPYLDRLLKAAMKRRFLDSLALQALMKATDLLGLALAERLRQYRENADPVLDRFAQLQEQTLHVALLREALDILASRWDKLPERQRPHFTPEARFRILRLRALLAWPAHETARTFRVSEATVHRWEQEALSKPQRPTIGSLLKPVPPVRRFADVARHVVQTLVLAGFPGDRSTAAHLARAGWRLSRRSIQRIRKQKPIEPTPLPPQTSPAGRAVRARFVHHVWMLDLTEIPGLLRLFSFKLEVDPVFRTTGLGGIRGLLFLEGSRDHDEADAKESQPGVQGEGSARGAARTGDGGGDRATVPAAHERGDELEAAAGGERRAGVRGWGEPRRGGAGERAAEEDRGADGGAGFFIARARAAPVSERRRLVSPDEQVSVRRQCELLGISRSGVYYVPVEPDSEELELMRQIDELHLDYPFYGSRSIARELRGRGCPANRKRVQRLMRLMGLESVAPKPDTSRPNEEHPVYPYLLRGLTISRANQVWATDITYIPLARGYAYLVAIMDWHTRRVLSWRLSNTMDPSFCVEAVQEALSRFGRPEIFNSDQGSQFTSKDFTDVLLDAGVKISMDGKGRCLDNVFVERLWRSLKYEDIYIKAYADLVEARAGIGRYFAFYNTLRRHQALGYQTPASFSDGLLGRAA